MAPSYTKIDYRVRPAKSIERKMLAESFRRLSEFGSLIDYRYVGLGSIYFSDFSLFHRALGFEHMISIENASDGKRQRRFQLNVPYGHIEMMFGHTNAILQRLSWEPRSVVWLDYDGPLESSCLIDVLYLTQRLVAGSVLLISVNAGNINIRSEDESEAARKRTALDALKDVVGKAAVPHDLQSKDLSGWGVAKAYRRILNDQIEDALLTRNSTDGSGPNMKYRQLYNFHYKDGVPMLTIGGLFYSEDQEAMVEKCGFERLGYFRSGEDPYLIDPPLLTFKEMRQIDSLRNRPTDDLPLDPRDIERYQQTYRYFPNFVEAEMA